MKLGKSESFRVFDDHDSGFWDINSNFDHGSWDEHYGFPIFEVGHDLLFFRGFEFPMEKSNFSIKFWVEILHFIKGRLSREDFI